MKVNADLLNNYLQCMNPIEDFSGDYLYFIVSDVVDWKDYFDESFKNDLIQVHKSNVDSLKSDKSKVSLLIPTLDNGKAGFSEPKKDITILRRCLFDTREAIINRYCDKLGIKEDSPIISTKVGYSIVTIISFNAVLTVVTQEKKDYQALHKLSIYVRSGYEKVYDALKTYLITVPLDDIARYPTEIPEIGTKVCYYFEGDDLVKGKDVYDIEYTREGTFVYFEKEDSRVSTVRPIEECFLTIESVKRSLLLKLNDD